MNQEENQNKSISGITEASTAPLTDSSGEPSAEPFAELSPESAPESEPEPSPELSAETEPEPEPSPESSAETEPETSPESSASTDSSPSIMESVSNNIKGLNPFTENTKEDDAESTVSDASTTDDKDAEMNNHRTHVDRVISFNASLKKHKAKYYDNLAPKPKRTMKKKIVHHLGVLLRESLHKKYEDVKHTRRLKTVMNVKHSLDKHFKLIFDDVLKPGSKKSKKSKKSKRSKKLQHKLPVRGVDKENAIYGRKDFNENRYL